MDTSERFYKLSLRVASASIGINAALALWQFFLGLATRSVAVMADAADSLRDIVATTVIIIGMRVSRKPADEEHPFGHGRAEDVGGLIAAIFLFLVGLTFLKDSLLRLAKPVTLDITPFSVVVMFAIAAVKFIMGAVTLKTARRAGSQALETDAYHHYTDFITTLVVAVGLILAQKGVRYVDSLLGLGIAGLIIYWSSKMTWEFIDKLLGRRASQDVYEQVKNIALTFATVRGVHDIAVHSYGRQNLISMHVEVHPGLTLLEAHSVASGVEDKINQAGLGKCVVHLDVSFPADACGKEEIEKVMRELMSFSHRIKDFHGLEVISAESGAILNFHLLLEKHTSLQESHALSHRLAQVLKDKFSFVKVNIHLEPYKGRA